MPRTALGTCFLLLCSSALAEPVARFAAPETLGRTLEVRLYVYAAASEKVVERSLAVASRLLGDARVTTRWRVCRVGEESAACGDSIGSRELLVQLLPLEQRSEDAALGMAIQGSDGRPGRHARVFWRGVAALAHANRVDPDKVLGHVLAHEIGHLLLGEGGHSRRGLMRADWSKADLGAMQGPGLRFDRRETARIGQMPSGDHPARTGTVQAAGGRAPRANDSR